MKVLTLNTRTISFLKSWCCCQMSSNAKAASVSSRLDILKRQNELFTSHKAKEMSAKVPRIEKIEVNYKGRNIADDATMLVNKNLTTPHQCAKHISNHMADTSVLALVKILDKPESQDGVVVAVKNEGEEEFGGNSASTEIITVVEKEESRWIPWDMHRPLETECELKLLNFAMNVAQPWETQFVNKAYWRSSALVLAAVAQEAFEDDLTVKGAYFPDIPEKCGAFCYDMELDKSLLEKDGEPKWQPDESTLITLTKTARHILSQKLQFERLTVHKDVAMEIFQWNEHMLRRIEETYFSSVSNHLVPVYRFGNYIDICDGPLLPDTSFLYHYVVTAVHQLRNANDPGTCLWRFQGLSLPKRLQVHHAVWSMLEHRARNLVTKRLPFKIMNLRTHRPEVPLHKYKSIEGETKKYNIATGQWLQDKWDSSNEKLQTSIET